MEMAMDTSKMETPEKTSVSGEPTARRAWRAPEFHRLDGRATGSGSLPGTAETESRVTSYGTYAVYYSPSS